MPLTLPAQGKFMGEQRNCHSVYAQNYLLKSMDANWEIAAFLYFSKLKLLMPPNKNLEILNTNGHFKFVLRFLSDLLKEIFYSNYQIVLKGEETFSTLELTFFFQSS